MNERLDKHALMAAIRDAYAAEPADAAQRIESMLKVQLAGQPPRQARALLLEIAADLSPERQPCGITADQKVLARVFELLLGRNAIPEDLSATELAERLAQSLNTIFDTLNHLIGVINRTLSGGADAGEQTIRHFIGFHLDGQDQTEPLEAHLGRISAAFLTTQEAFKKAAHAKVAQILETLDPGKIAAERTGGLKIGPLRKAEDYDILNEKIDRIRRWFDSGRFMEDFLREFEKQCHGTNP